MKTIPKDVYLALFEAKLAVFVKILLFLVGKICDRIIRLQKEKNETKLLFFPLKNFAATCMFNCDYYDIYFKI